MEVIITNKFTVVKSPSDDIVRGLKSMLTYRDKQKAYQLRRLKNNPFKRNTPYVKKLEKEVDCCILKDIKGGHVAFNSGLSYIIEGKSRFTIEDRRIETGKTVSLPWQKKPFSLRPYQQEAVDAAVDNWRGVINFATGMGKTLTATHLLKKLRKKSLIVVPSESIAKQFYKELSDAFGENRIGYYGGGKKKVKDLTVGIAASVVKNIDAFDDLGVIIFDEVHHIAASTFYEIAVGLGDTGRIYGLTATDYRSDGKDILINAGCGSVIIKKDIKWGIENGFLAKPKFIVKEVNTLGEDHKRDKLKNYKEHVLHNDQMKDQIREDIQGYMSEGKSVLCLVGEVAHGEELSKQLGIPFAQGKDKQSQKYVEQLNAGEIPALVGTGGKISEGTDTKNVDVLILASFMASKGPVIQSVGRALRKQGTKTEALIIDYIPKGSEMLKRHAYSRIDYYKEITNDVVVEGKST
jgi:superfamily II DNA or RNA helicase